MIEVTGRTYPVEVRYRPVGDDRRSGAGRHRRRRRAGAAGARATCSCSSRESARSTTRADALRRLELHATPRCSRCTPGCRRRSSTASSNPIAAGASCSARTSPRRRSPFPACATSSMPAPPGSPATAAASRSNDCRSNRSRRRRRTSGPGGVDASPREPAFACTARTTSTPARSSPSQRSCAPTWRQSSSR